MAPWREVWSGADASANVWLVYTGMTVAPHGEIHGEGVLFRTAAGYGEYRYQNVTAVDDKPREFAAKTYFTDVLIGYLARLGELTAKAFVGASMISHDIEPLDEYALVTGSELGVKGVLELWLNMGPNAWGSLDIGWAQAHNTRSARVRAGYRVHPFVSVGLEGNINLDAQAECRMEGTSHSGCKITYGDNEVAGYMDYARGGGFLRYEWETGEVSISGGILGGSFDAGLSDEPKPYMTFTWLTQF